MNYQIHTDPALHAAFYAIQQQFIADGYPRDDAIRVAQAVAQERFRNGTLLAGAQAHQAQRRSSAAEAAGRHRDSRRGHHRAAQEQGQQQEAEDANEAAEAEDEAGADEDIYEQYKPAKVEEGLPHPDPIVETASLASVKPPDISYQHHLQANVAANQLSNAQLETVLYAFQRFNQRLPDGSRAGFFLGDGAGVGKGRQIAAVIKEFWATGGRRVLWVSTSTDLRFDARRDLADLGAADVPVLPPRKDSVPSGNLESVYPRGGVLFITYSLLVSKGSYQRPPRQAGGRGAGAGG
ncbi:hypothetical protein Agub_g10014, partial [Astrephomene gubernaculifera]